MTERITRKEPKKKKKKKGGERKITVVVHWLETQKIPLLPHHMGFLYHCLFSLLYYFSLPFPAFFPPSAYFIFNPSMFSFFFFFFFLFQFYDTFFVKKKKNWRIYLMTTTDWITARHSCFIYLLDILRWQQLLMFWVQIIFWKLLL